MSRLNWILTYFFLVHWPSSDAGEVNVYLLGGQSNMQGIGKVAELGDEVPRTIPNAYFFNGTDFEVLDLTSTPISTRRGEFGPEVGLALATATPDQPIYIIKYHRSGMPLHHGWNGGTWIGGKPAPSRRNFYPGTSPSDVNQGVLYKQMLNRFLAGIEELEEQGYTPVIRGFVWMQGEQDSKNKESASHYASNLKRLQKRLGKDIGVQGNLPIVYGQVLPYEPAASRFSHRNEIRRQMAQADGRSGSEQAIENARMVSTDSISLLPDTVHYDSHGQLKLGREFGLALKALLNNLRTVDQDVKDNPGSFLKSNEGANE